MIDHGTERADAAAHRRRRKRRAALLLGSLLGSLVLVLVATFACGVYWGSSRQGLWLLQKQQAWFGWDIQASALANAQRVHNARRGNDAPDRPLDAPTIAVADETNKKGTAARPNHLAVPAPAPSSTTTKALSTQAAAPKSTQDDESAPASVATKTGLSPTTTTSLAQDASSHAPDPADALPGASSPPSASTDVPTGADLDEQQAPARDGSTLANLEDPPSGQDKPQAPPTPASVRARFELPAKVGVMLVVDAQAFPDPKACQRARSALHSAGVQFQAWLNLEIEARGCLPWVGQASSARARGEALAALDLPGTDLLLAVTRQGQISMPDSSRADNAVFNAGLSLAQVPGGNDDAAMRRALMHAIGQAMGAKPLPLGSHPDAKRGSVMASQPSMRKDWLDEPNRLRMLERKSWPFRRDAKSGRGGPR